MLQTFLHPVCFARFGPEKPRIADVVRVGAGIGCATIPAGEILQNGRTAAASFPAGLCVQLARRSSPFFRRKFGARGIHAHPQARQPPEERVNPAGQQARFVQGLAESLAALWSDIPVQRCTVHKHRNLLAHALDRLHDELSADYKDRIYVGTKQEIETKRKAFIRKWRLKCKAVADSLEEAGDKLFTFTRFPKSQWKSIRTSNAIERLHEEFKRRIKTQTVCLPRKLPRCCSGPCWLLARSRCARWTVGKASPRGLPIKSLTLPHDQIS